MGCNNHHDDKHHKMQSCVCEVLRAIKDIQDDNNHHDDDCFDCKDCFIEPLGDLAGSPRRRHADTRVITLTTKKGKPFFAFFGPIETHSHDSKHPHHSHLCTSIFFRVEEVFDNCCARLRVLIPLDEHKHPVDLAEGCCINLEKVCKVEDFRRTRSCVTVDLNEFIAVQCIKDVDLNICD